MNLTIHQGNCLRQLRRIPDASVHCCVTSPPYWGLRDYGVKGQIGLEPTVDRYLRRMVAVFAEVWRVMRDDGTLWLNLGDCYTASASGGQHFGKHLQNADGNRLDRDTRKLRLARGGNRIGNRSSFRRDRQSFRSVPHKGADGLRPKNLIGIPWRVAFALQEFGWNLRADIIWHKPNPMPESVTDRPTKAHEYIFLMTKSPRYFYDAEAIKEAASPDTHARYARGRSDNHKWADGGPLARTLDHMVRKPGVNPKAAHNGKNGSKQNESFAAAVKDVVDTRNKRTVWTVPTHPYSGAHFATFPPDLIKPCILAGCPLGGTVLDPFGGSGTTGMVALEYGRNAVLIELNPEYAELARRRCNVTPGLPI